MQLCNLIGIPYQYRETAVHFCKLPKNNLFQENT